MKTFLDILQRIRKESSTEREKGKNFEKLIKNYLLTDPLYREKFSSIYLWNEFPYKSQFQDKGLDVGIDLIGVKKYSNNEKEYIAIQCKCLKEDSVVTKESVDSFLSTSSKTFIDSNGIKQKFSLRIFVSTVNHWSDNAESVIKEQNPPVQRITLSHLENADVNWEDIEKGLYGVKSSFTKKEPLEHQKEAIEKVHNYFKREEKENEKNGVNKSVRGKLIMACGTGKTFTSLCITENETKKGGIALYLVPSIALLGQTLREYMTNCTKNIYPICVCSDSEVGKNKNQDDTRLSTVDLSEPATTNVSEICKKILKGKSLNKDLIIIFSTYQSIEKVIEAQKQIVRNDKSFIFDMIICDEAHRTTGYFVDKSEQSMFTMVNDEKVLRAKKRLYMTATPRIYGESSKEKVKQLGDASEIYSMDDERIYGKEIYRLSFGRAVSLGLLSDYKVMVLTVKENEIPKEIIKIKDDVNKDITIKEKDKIEDSDIAKLVGCMQALSKNIIGDDGKIRKDDNRPMNTALAFCQTISKSKQITKVFNKISEVFTLLKANRITKVYSEHVDGTMSAPQRDEKLDFLRNATNRKFETRVLTNVRCLSEGVDVPSLDAVMFLVDKSSEIDLIQSIGRVMRKAKNKAYGYIIIPVIVKSYKNAEKELNDNNSYQTLWKILRALRAHDERFNAIINLKNAKSGSITIGKGAPYGIGDPEPYPGGEEFTPPINESGEQSFINELEYYQESILAKIVDKVGEKLYFDKFAEHVAKVSKGRIENIKRMLSKKGKHQDAFNNFVNELKKSINPQISNDDALEMLSQHIIIKPIFECLFKDYVFLKENPVSKLMENMLSALDRVTLLDNDDEYKDYIQKINTEISAIDTPSERQRRIKELYEKFFKFALPKEVQKLGIVYTPIPVVDFIIRSVEAVLNKEFNKSLNDKNLNILDPFTGTGTFITRLLSLGIINKNNIERKYNYEIFANEIMLLPYYTACVNIESTFHDIIKEKDKFHEFKGICLTDTFETYENSDFADKKKYDSQNIERIKREKDSVIQVIIGNPPYSAGQKAANDDAQNQKYEKLDARVTETYVRNSNVNLKNSLYDSYIKAFRYSTDKIGNNKGIIAFITNSGFIDGNVHGGFRKVIEREFSKIYILNLKGGIRGKKGDDAKKEGGNVFDIMQGVAITILIKDNTKKDKSEIYYYDIGDYLSREAKFNILNTSNDIYKLNFKKIHPNKYGDWISKRNKNFKTYTSIKTDKNFSNSSKSFFNIYSLGVSTNRDDWSYNFSLETLQKTTKESIKFYNEQRIKLNNGEIKDVKKSTNKINWSDSIISKIKRNIIFKYDDCMYRESLYRPFIKENILFDKHFIDRMSQVSYFIPTSNHRNIIICKSNIGENYSVFITNMIPDYHITASTQCFPLYWYEDASNAKDKEDEQLSFLEPVKKKEKVVGGYIRHEAVTDYILNEANKKYKKHDITKEDIFYYVYGILHSKDYRETFKDDLKRELPRIPLLDTYDLFKKFSEAGRKLADIHLNYEQQERYVGCNVVGEKSKNYEIKKMKFLDKSKKDIIIYNDSITIENIPSKAYKYEINGRSAVEWVMEYYQVKVMKKSEVLNDPNLWCKEHNNPKYILDLLLKVINVSVKSVDIIEKLPKLEF